MTNSVVEQQMIAEADLVFQAKNGDVNAYGVLYQRHWDAIYSYILRRVTVVCEAEDLAQVVFLKAWQAIKDYQPSATPFRGWLYRIAHNTVVDHYRTQKKNLQWEDLTTVADPATTPESALLEAERTEAIRGALTTLHPSYRDVVTHRFIDEKDYAETARALDRKVNNVRVLQHRALSALRRTLGQESALWIAFAATAITLFFGTTVVQAATRALPDERFYPVRTLVEDARLALADDAGDIRLHMAYASQRVVDLHALSQEDRVEAMDETVAQLSSHISSASVKANELSSTGAGGTAVKAQVDQALLDQELSLADLESRAAPATREYVQSAMDAVMDARHELHGDSVPSTGDPPPGDPAGSEHSAPPTITSAGHISSTRPIPTTVLATPMSQTGTEVPNTEDQPVSGAPVTTRPEPRPEAPIPAARSAEPASDMDDSPFPPDTAAAGGPPLAGDATPHQAPEHPPAGSTSSPNSMPQSFSEEAKAQNRTEPAGQASESLPASHEAPHGIPHEEERSSDSDHPAPAQSPQAEPSIVDGERPDPVHSPDTPIPDAPDTDLSPLEDGHHPTEPPPAGAPEQEQDTSSRAPASSPNVSEDPAGDAPRAESPSDRPDAKPPSQSD